MWSTHTARVTYACVLVLWPSHSQVEHPAIRFVGDRVYGVMCSIKSPRQRGGGILPPNQFTAKTGLQVYLILISLKATNFQLVGPSLPTAQHIPPVYNLCQNQLINENMRTICLQSLLVADGTKSSATKLYRCGFVVEAEKALHTDTFTCHITRFDVTTTT